MLKENIFNNKENILPVNINGNIFGPEIGVFKTLDYDLDLIERQVKFDKYDYILCEDCNQEIDKQHYYCEDCYNKETDHNERNHMNYEICKFCFKSNRPSY